MIKFFLVKFAKIFAIADLFLLIFLKLQRNEIFFGDLEEAVEFGGALGNVQGRLALLISHSKVNARMGYEDQNCLHTIGLLSA